MSQLWQWRLREQVWGEVLECEGNYSEILESIEDGRNERMLCRFVDINADEAVRLLCCNDRVEGVAIAIEL